MQRSWLGALILLFLVAGCSVWAGSIPITNPTFAPTSPSDLTLGCTSAVTCPGTNWTGGPYSHGTTSTNTIPDWVVSNPSHSGVWDPNTGAGGVIGSVPVGSYVGFAGGSAPSTIAQDTGTTVQLGSTYNLQVNVGWRTDLPWNAPDIALETCTGSYSGCTILAEQAAPKPTQGGWSTDTLVWDATTGGGDELYVFLINNGLPTGGSEQADFNDVLLGMNPGSGAPEPASMALIGLGLCGIAALRRRARR